MESDNINVCSESVYVGIFNEYADQLFNFLYYKCGSKSQAQDLTQEAFLKLWQKCAEVSFKAAKGFVFTVARNAMLNQFERKKVKLKFESSQNTLKHAESPEFQMEYSEAHRRLQDAISALPEKQREVFLMSRIDKMKYQEIADLLGISKKAVEKRMYAALDKLRKTIKMIK